MYSFILITVLVIGISIGIYYIYKDKKSKEPFLDDSHRESIDSAIEALTEENQKACSEGNISKSLKLSEFIVKLKSIKYKN